MTFENGTFYRIEAFREASLFELSNHEPRGSQAKDSLVKSLMLQITTLLADLLLEISEIYVTSSEIIMNSSVSLVWFWFTEFRFRLQYILNSIKFSSLSSCV